MIGMSASDIAAATGATLLAPGSRAVTGEAVIDSRRVGDGSLFVAFVGERLDGNEYLAAAARSGAAAVVASREVDADSVFAQKGDTCFETCLVARDGGSYTLQVSYYEADGPVDEAAWDEMRDEGPEEASYVVEVDHTGQITDVEAAD